MKQCFNELNQWFKKSKGQRLAFHINRVLSPVLENLTGDVLLQFGIEEHCSWLDSSPINKQLISLPFQGDNKSSVVASMYELPFDENSIDVIFCPFTMELLHHQTSFLCEVDRVLSPNGHVIFCGVNPCSLWGVPRLWHHKSKFSVWGSGLISSGSLRNKLANFSFVVDDVKHFVFWPPFIKHLFAERFYEQMGRMILPFPSGLYLLVAKKQTYSPIKQTFLKKESILIQPAIDF